MLRFDIDVAASDKESRTITGIAVPFGKTAELGGVAYSFQPGSLVKGRAITPLLLDHSTDRPVGVLADLSDGEDGAIATFRVDNTADGDAALATAASGSRGGLSVGVNVVAAEDAEGVQVVSRASLMEISLCAIPAFADAQVTTVTASETTNDTTEEVEVSEQQTAPEAEITQEQPQVAASIPAPKVRMSLGEFVGSTVSAMRGDRKAADVLAALEEDFTTDVPGIIPTVFENQILNRTTAATTLYDLFRKEQLPSSGKEITWPRMDPVGAEGWRAWDAGAPSEKITIGTKTVQISPWSLALAIHQDVENRSAVGSFVEIAYSEMADQYLSNREAQIAALLDSAKVATATSWGDAVEQVWVNGQPYNIVPNAIACTPAFHQYLLEAEGFMKYSDGNASGLPYAGSIGGLKVYVSPMLTSNYVVSTGAITYMQSESFRLSAANVSALEYEIAMTRYTAVTANYNPQTTDGNGANPGDAGYVPSYDDALSVAIVEFPTP